MSPNTEYQLTKECQHEQRPMFEIVNAKPENVVGQQVVARTGKQKQQEY
jgi:hypothetical protein